MAKWATFGPKPELTTLASNQLAIAKIKALAEVKELRRLGLDKAAVSPGILAIYSTNYIASQNLLAGEGSTVLKTGATSEEYLAGFGANLGMTALQFANYIIAENKRVGPPTYTIEQRYLALTYAGDVSLGILPITALATEQDINQAVESFRSYCLD